MDAVAPNLPLFTRQELTRNASMSKGMSPDISPASASHLATGVQLRLE
jgi:hypothetical protein